MSVSPPLEAGNFLISAQPDGPSYVVFLTERRDGLHYYVDLVNDPRFAWFEWTKKVPTFETTITSDQILEYHDRLSSVFHKIGQPTQRMSENSLERLKDMCTRISKASKKKGKS